MRRSNSRPSSSTPTTVDLGWRCGISDFGIPKICYCGELMVIEESTSVKYTGRKYFTCPDYMDEGDHKWKWWDQVVDEELSNIHISLEEHAEKIAGNSDHTSPALDNLLETLEGYGAEIEELRDQSGHIQVEISKFKELICRRGDRYVIVLLFLAIAVVAFLAN